ncbi:MAG TPA: ABC transporter ATP-binding protein [Gemmatimonadaceae bacterium]|nr:ABC transporter ATP-binding protein [Gemmatimonadaceae bacterium]
MKPLRRLLPYLAPYRVSLTVGLLLVIASSALTSVIPWLLRLAIDALRAGAPTGRIWMLGGAMVGLAVVGGAMRYGMREVMNGISRRVEFDLRNALFAHLESLDAAYYARTRTGDLMARLTNDLSAVRMAAGPAIMYLVNTIAGGLFALAFMLRISPRLTLWALLPMALLPILTVWLGRAIHERFEAVQEHFGTLTTRAQENLAGARIVRAYRQEDAELSRFGALGEEYLEKNMRLARLYGTMNPAFGLLAGLGAVVVLGYGGALALRGAISVGAFVAFGFYLSNLTWPLIALGWVINLFQRGGASMARLNEIFDAAPAVDDARATRSLPPAVDGRSLEFRDVGFHYPSSDGGEPRWVLRHVSFTVPAGGTLGVVGATGSGKSALIDLIPRLYDPQEGEILLDGVPTRDLPLAELRREIGYVPQESLLFSDTIGSNVGYGLEDGSGVADRGSGHVLGIPRSPSPTPDPRPVAASDAEPTPAAVHWAASVAQLDETIAGFPGGYDTLLGERGINLSGGQRQRAALARALARRPSLVLLDDALSAVDTHTEAEILRSLRGALRERTAVIASHRISAIRDATWIVVLDDGRVVEQGRHDALIAAGGRYWSLLRRQQLEESIEGDGAGDGEVVGDQTTLAAGTAEG